MALANVTDRHRRRFGRNVGVAACLVAFAALFFGLTIAKITGGSLMEGYDHVPRASVLPVVEE